MPIIPGAWTDQQPSVRVCWLELHNAMRRWPLLAPAFALSLAAIGAFVGFSPVRVGVAEAANHPILVVAITGLLFAMMIQRRRRRLARNRHRDWLATLPREFPLSARAAYFPFLGWACAAFALFTAGIISRLAVVSAGKVVFASGVGLLAAVTAVAAAAALQRRPGLNQKRARRPSRFAPPPSRYAAVRKPRTGWATHASLVPLGYWPMAQAKFWERPKVRARALLPLLLSLPDVVGAAALAAVLVWLVTIHLGNLLVGVVRVAFAAACWLAPTPVGAAQFTFAVSHRALVGVIASCALLVFMVALAGGTRALRVSVESVVIWIAVACILSTAACLIALRSKSVARSVVHRWLR